MSNRTWNQIAAQAIQTVANKEGKTVSEIRTEIQEAIIQGFQNSDLLIESRWKEIPRIGDIPTPEETMLWICQRIAKTALTE